MDAFGGVGGIFGALLQTGNYQLGTGTLAAGSGRNIVLVAATIYILNGVSIDSQHSGVITAPSTCMLTPGAQIYAYMPYNRAVESPSSGVIRITTDSIEIDAGIANSLAPWVSFLYLYTT